MKNAYESRYFQDIMTLRNTYLLIKQKLINNSNSIPETKLLYHVSSSWKKREDDIKSNLNERKEGKGQIRFMKEKKNSMYIV